MDNKNMLKVHGCATCKGKLCVEKIDLFSNLDREEHVELIKLVKRRTYKKGERLFDVGDSFDSLFVINQGKVKIHEYTVDGDEKIYYILKESDVIGEISLLKQTEFSFMATALEDTKVCIIKKKDFDDFIQDKKEVTFKIFEYAYKKITSLETQVKILLSSKSINKVAGIIIKLKKEQGTNRVRFIQTQEEMARSIGITRETFSRKLNKLKKEGIIAYDNNVIEIHKLDRLFELSPFNTY